MSTKAPTLRQFQDRFPTEDSCLDHLMRTRYGARHDCQGCEREASYYRVKGRRSYACEHCGYQVYPTAGTPCDRTRTPLRDWFYVMFLFTTSRNGVAAKRVERELGVTYKTAWRMCHMIREYMGQVDGDGPLGGPDVTVEIDETIVGGSVSGMGSGYMGNKSVVVGIKERGGRAAMRVVSSRTRAPMEAHIHASILPGTTISSDEFGSYRFLGQQGYRHITVSHKSGRHVGKHGASTNAVEGLWAQLKRSINGTHIHVSGKHLPKYLAEHEFRHNMRQYPHLMLDRLMVSFAR